jgi:hypothetical protein
MGIIRLTLYLTISLLVLRLVYAVAATETDHTMAMLEVRDGRNTIADLEEKRENVRRQVTPKAGRFVG